jgi:hypothetical protein
MPAGRQLILGSIVRLTVIRQGIHVALITLICRVLRKDCVSLRLQVKIFSQITVLQSKNISFK